jgi:hypothetical protein
MSEQPHVPPQYPTPEQEQKRLAFEAKQERKRQEFELRLEKQKAKRDWMMVIITFAAVAVAFLTGWEAHRARLEAAQAAEKSLSIQKESVEAQIKAFKAQIDSLHTDVRPYLSVIPGKITISRKKDEIYLDTLIMLKVDGKTPALEVRTELNCSLENNFMGMTASAEAQTYMLDSFVYPQQPIPHKCSASIAKYSDRTVLLVNGQVKYTDVNRESLISPFCYYIPKPFRDNKNVIQCPQATGKYN